MHFSKESFRDTNYLLLPDERPNLNKVEIRIGKSHFSLLNVFSLLRKIIEFRRANIFKASFLNTSCFASGFQLAFRQIWLQESDFVILFYIFY